MQFITTLRSAFLWNGAEGFIGLALAKHLLLYFRLEPQLCNRDECYQMGLGVEGVYTLNLDRSESLAPLRVHWLSKFIGSGYALLLQPYGYHGRIYWDVWIINQSLELVGSA